MRNLGLCQSRSGHFPALDLFRLSLHTASLQPGGSSHPNQALKWTIPIERWSTMSSGFPAPRMAGHFGGGTTVPPVDLLPTGLKCACRIVSGAVPPVVQAADRTVRQAGQESGKGSKRSVSWRFSAAKLSIFRSTLRACQDGGVFRQPIWISWSPFPSGLAMESDPGQVSRGLYISGLPIAVTRKQL